MGLYAVAIIHDENRNNEVDTEVGLKKYLSNGSKYVIETSRLIL